MLNSNSSSTSSSTPSVCTCLLWVIGFGLRWCHWFGCKWKTIESDNFRVRKDFALSNHNYCWCWRVVYWEDGIKDLFPLCMVNSISHKHVSAIFHNVIIPFFLHSNVHSVLQWWCELSPQCHCAGCDCHPHWWCLLNRNAKSYDRSVTNREQRHTNNGGGTNSSMPHLHINHNRRIFPLCRLLSCIGFDAVVTQVRIRDYHRHHHCHHHNKWQSSSSVMNSIEWKFYYYGRIITRQ